MSKFFGVALAVLGGLVIANVVSSVREKREEKILNAVALNYELFKEEHLNKEVNAGRATKEVTVSKVGAEPMRQKIKYTLNVEGTLPCSVYDWINAGGAGKVKADLKKRGMKKIKEDQIRKVLEKHK